MVNRKIAIFGGSEKPTDFVVCRLCSLPCAIRCSECYAVLDDHADSCPACKAVFCNTQEEWEAGEPHRMGIAVCKHHAMSESNN